VLSLPAQSKLDLLRGTPTIWHREKALPLFPLLKVELKVTAVAGPD